MQRVQKVMVYAIVIALAGTSTLYIGTWAGNALAGGYKNEYLYYDGGSTFDYNSILLDKEFWVALGKQLGWQITNPIGNKIIPTWKFKAHQFLDARFEGREQEFFKELIEKR